MNIIKMIIKNKNKSRMKKTMRKSKNLKVILPTMMLIKSRKNNKKSKFKKIKKLVMNRSKTIKSKNTTVKKASITDSKCKTQNSCSSSSILIEK
jgi:hypothetical protein